MADTETQIVVPATNASSETRAGMQASAATGGDAGERAEGRNDHVSAKTPVLSRRIASYAWTVLDGTAAVCSTTTPWLMANPKAQRVVAASSGVAWAVGGGVQEIANVPRRTYASFSNGFGTLAGILSAAASLVSQNAIVIDGAGVIGDTIIVGYASAGAWGVNGAVTLGRAFLESGETPVSRALTGLNGAANLTAAILSATSVHATSVNNNVGATSLATASGVVWFAGSVAGLVAAWTQSGEQEVVHTPRRTDEENERGTLSPPPTPPARGAYWRAVGEAASIIRPPNDAPTADRLPETQQPVAGEENPMRGPELRSRPRSRGL